MAKLLQILCAGAFAEHLLHGVTGNNVREQKNHCEDEPERRKREHQTQ